MPIGDPVEILILNDEDELETYYKAHLLKTNKTKSTEYVEAGGERSSAFVTFTLRWNKLLEPVEFDMPSYRLKWRGHMFDIVGFDDFMYQHRKVDLSCRSFDYSEFSGDEDDGLVSMHS